MHFTLQTTLAAYVYTYNNQLQKSYFLITLISLGLYCLHYDTWIGCCFQAHSISLRAELFTTNMVWGVNMQPFVHNC